MNGDGYKVGSYRSGKEIMPACFLSFQLIDSNLVAGAHAKMDFSLPLIPVYLQFLFAWSRD